jgi:NAD(P)-dependent dehydrogenase (short-subunit alcohol dehydrogenase family)
MSVRQGEVAMKLGQGRNWTVEDIPNQTGKLAVVTGATGGLGFETALELARAGSEVVLAGRNAAKGAEAIRRILAVAPLARIRFELVDLASLASVTTFANRLLEEGRAIDVLVNNAAIMANPKRQTTVDGFELQLGTNYLSHFALTGRLLPLILKSGNPRVVQVSSGAHRMGRNKIDFDDLQSERKYSPWNTYCQSKQAMLMFALELQRLSAAHSWGIRSNAAHPGYARTDLIANGPGKNSVQSRMSIFLGRFLSQTAADGALPTLYAATDPDAQPAGYYGPRDRFELRGPVVNAVIGRAAKDEAAAQRLWEISEQLTGVTWPATRGGLHLAS